jgi:hypothetical protein
MHTSETIQFAKRIFVGLGKKELLIIAKSLKGRLRFICNYAYELEEHPDELPMNVFREYYRKLVHYNPMEKLCIGHGVAKIFETYPHYAEKK